MAKIFLSYAREDEAQVVRLGNALRQVPHEVWQDRTGIPGGELVSRQIDQALRQSEIVIVCLSRAALRSEWVEVEFHSAFMMRMQRQGSRKLRIIPVCFEEVRPEGLMGLFRRVDLFSDHHWESGIQDLLDAIAAEESDLQESEGKRQQASSGRGPAPGAEVSIPLPSLKDSDTGRRIFAAGALGHLGPAAMESLPDLLQALDDPAPEVVGAVLQALGKIAPEHAELLPPLVRLLESEQHGGTAARMLVRFGAAAAPHLCEALGESARRERAMEVLRAIGLPAAPRLIEALFEAEEPGRAGIVQVLTTLGLPVIPLLLRATGEREADWDAGCSVLVSLGEPVVPELLRVAREGDEAARRGALRALAAMPDLERTLPVEQLLWLLDKSETGEGWPFAQALVRTGGPHAEAAGAYVMVLGDEDERLRQESMELLTRLRAAALPSLRNALRWRHPRLLQNVLVVLRQLGMLAREARPEILDVYTVFEPLAVPWMRAVAEHAADALLAMAMKEDADLPPSVPLRALSSANVNIRHRALKGQLPQEEPVLEQLIRCLSDSDPANRKLAAGQLAKAGARAVPVMRRILASSKPEAALSLLEVLPRLGPSASDAMPEVLDTLARLTLTPQELAMAAGKQGPPVALPAKAMELVTAQGEKVRPLLREHGERCLPVILERLADPRPDQRQVAAWALLETDKAVAQLPVLRGWLDDPKKAPFAIEAFVRLGKLGMQPLRQTKSHRNEAVRRLARAGLEELGMGFRAGAENSDLRGEALFEAAIDSWQVVVLWTLGCSAVALAGAHLGMGSWQVVVPAGALLGLMGLTAVATQRFQQKYNKPATSRIEGPALVLITTVLFSIMIWGAVALLASSATMGLGPFVLLGTFFGLVLGVVVARA